MNQEETESADKDVVRAGVLVANLTRIFAVVSVLSLAVAAYAAENSVPQDVDEPTILVRNGAADGPLVNERYEYYEVCGCCQEELQCDLSKKCIRKGDGKKYDSATEWKVTWEYDHAGMPEICAAASFRVTVDIVYHYPKWAIPSNAPPQLVEKWKAYLKNLEIHEKGHRDRAVGAATELSRTVSKLPLSRTCSDLDRAIRALCRTRLARLKDDQKQYDAATNHGVVQGAVFP